MATHPVTLEDPTWFLLDQWREASGQSRSRALGKLILLAFAPEFTEPVDDAEVDNGAGSDDGQGNVVDTGLTGHGGGAGGEGLTGLGTDREGDAEFGAGDSHPTIPDGAGLLPEPAPLGGVPLDEDLVLDAPIVNELVDAPSSDALAGVAPSVGAAAVDDKKISTKKHAVKK